MMQQVPTLPLVERLSAGQKVTLTTSDQERVTIQPEIRAGQLTGNYLSSVLPDVRYDDPRIILKETLAELEDVRHVTINNID
ncbi:hypothetical protein [Levilactobacillus acidifarinae]|uniref:Uncharacterized protein n=1 Tax=Levilactobacillus acidifarinae DSM 19394 = JCM 15949 TaxID=1423715 RepID=A0A0R1LLB8_9LACO|nr:hypothetical protein [Levilactobacillus acidifarinae]KRK96715.1 hypothetical protein FD25_GL001794 [Levilactobacillus acidifarinae DSM 19394]GEO70412.1 hypothetical protein LAC03_23220 [Levilactobacillus acidifarinae]